MPAYPVFDPSLALVNPSERHESAAQKAGLVLVAAGLVAAVVAWASGLGARHPLAFSAAAFGGVIVGGLVYALDGLRRRGEINAGVAFSQNQARGAVGWVAALVVTGLYLVLYFRADLMGGLVPLGGPLSEALRGRPATVENGGQWFLYGTVYTVAVLVMGVRALVRYRDVRYHQVRTLSVMFFQLAFAFLLPALLVRLQEPELYPSYFWPLDYDLLWPSSFSSLREDGLVGAAMLVWGGIAIAVVTPVLTYFYGKRWYCSWVCGCGGLAETAGDPYRHLADTTQKAWRVERWMVHGVLAAIVLTTALLWLAPAVPGLEAVVRPVADAYALLIGLVFAGVVGVGFYPVMGSRVWCRFGCPMAAVLGLQQRFFSRFRVTTNGGQCISCGQCSAYCEMGIDVRAYAQRGQSVVRASCVGCGICAAVCPRGVLRLENGPETGGEARAGAAHLNLIGDLDRLDLLDEPEPAAA